MTCRVLLADPHRLVLEGLRLLLEPTHEVVGLVEDGEDLVREASRLHPGLVFLEVQLPGRSGLEAARRVTTLTAKPPASAAQASSPARARGARPTAAFRPRRPRRAGSRLRAARAGPSR